MQKINRWFALRLVLIALAVGSGLEGAASSTFSSDLAPAINWWVCVVVFVAATICAFYGIAAGYQAVRVDVGWNKPSWYQNPFQLRSQPLQFFHLVAVSAIAQGLGGMVRELSMRQYERIPLPGVVLALGLGAWIALRGGVRKFHP